MCVCVHPLPMGLQAHMMVLISADPHVYFDITYLFCQFLYFELAVFKQLLQLCKSWRVVPSKLELKVSGILFTVFLTMDSFATVSFSSVCSNHLFLTLSAPPSLLVCKFSLHYPCKISCLVMGTKQSIIHINLSKMKNKILPTCVKRNYRE